MPRKPPPPPPLTDIVAERVRAERQHRQLSQTAFAERCGLSPRTIQYVEQSIPGLRLVTVEALARGLDMEASELLRAS